MDTLVIRNLSKAFGPLTVLRDLDLRVPEHSVFGFIGKNGAGKTTTMKLILGFLKADAGDISVCGQPVRFGSAGTNRMIGYLPDVPAFYGDMTPQEYLTLCGRLSGLPDGEIRSRGGELLEMVGLSGVTRRIKGFSRGMKQRLGIAQALLHRPKLLICDEPTSALDPVGRKDILDILLQVRSQTTLLFSTHILSDVERICDTVGILEGGRLVLQGGLEELKQAHGHRRLALGVAETCRLAELRQRLLALPDTQAVTVEEGRLYWAAADLQQASRALMPLLQALDMTLTHFEQLEPGLEQVFLKAVGV